MGAGGQGGGLGTDKLLQLASSLAAKQLTKGPDACGQEELLLHLQILQVRVRLAGYPPHTLATGSGKEGTFCRGRQARSACEHCKPVISTFQN